MDIKHICTNCDLRHGGCLVKDDTFESMIKNEEDCPDFLLGKCFYCAMYMLEDTTLCPSYSDADGCDNFKPANNYNEYLKAKKSFDNDDIRLTDNMFYHNLLDRIKAKNRRGKDKSHKDRQIRKAKNAGGYHPGLYFDKETGRVKIWVRGSRSKWLKNQAHRKVRRKRIEDGFLYEKSLYKKQYDYWWELF